MSLSLLTLAGVLGLLSTVHCWGMCGGLMLAFATARGGVRHLLGFNFGRIASYSLAGALAGAAADVALGGVASESGHRGLQILSAGVLIASGLALLRWLPGRDRLGRLGLALWRRLQPLTRALLPADRFHQRFLLGMVWGWLPCGFVYSMLALVAAQGGARTGALLMLAFGLGTLPGMLAAQAGLGALRARLVRVNAPALAGVLLVASGIGLLWGQGLFASAPADPRAAHGHPH